MKGTTPRLRLRITRAAEAELRGGHPWLFAAAIREQNRDGKCGEIAVIYDRNDRFLAAGFYDPGSPIRVRVLHAGKPQEIDAAWWQAQLARAIERRAGLFGEKTNGYRIINGESDGWPGLVLDRYDTTLVLKLYTAAWLPMLPEITSLFTKQISGHERIVLRLSRNVQKETRRPDGEILRGPPLDGPVIFLENGLRFEADVLRGQKTGFFLDQRENRQWVESLARDRRILNAFSFSGGFSLYAARGGASSTTDLDISVHALNSARRNFALNQSNAAVAHCVHETTQADVFDWLRANTRRKFDLIILDPPSLAKRESERSGAIQAYEKLAASGLEHLSTEGILVASSCSAHVTAEEFFSAVRSAARKSRRQFDELRTARHAPDHPATFPEAEYLKAISLKF